MEAARQRQAEYEQAARESLVGADGFEGRARRGVRPPPAHNKPPPPSVPQSYYQQGVLGNYEPPPEPQKDGPGISTTFIRCFASGRQHRYG